MRCYLLALSVLMASLATAQEAVDWSSLVEKVMPAVVTIVSTDARDIVQGSGFIISSDGKIVTNFHVVAGKPAILARRSDGSFLVIKGILASDKANDLAILQAEGRNLPFVRLGDSDAVKVGEAICVIGSPMLLEGTVSAGIISAVRELRDGRKLLQITAPISEGSSGSPVFNRKGEVIGVASFILSEGQNLNFAVPSNAVKALLRRLGITLSPLPPSPTLSFEERFERAYQEAIQDAQKIEDAWARSEALRFIAEATAEAGQKEQANQVFQLALQVAQKIEGALDRSLALRGIAVAMAKVGQFDRALQIAQKIEDAKARSWALSGIAEATAEAGQTERANQVFQLALQAAQKIEDAKARSWALSGIAEAMAKAGQTERANQVFQLALQVAQKIEGALDRSWALRGIAVAMAKAGQFDRALQIAQKIEGAWVRSLALTEIAVATAEAGQFDRALEVAETIDNPFARLQALADIIAAKQKSGKGEAGKE
jgi:serine protease Do